MKTLIRYSFRFSLGMGLYGFTRGVRVQNKPSLHEKVPLLIGDRLVNGLCAMCVYALPGWNIYMLSRLMNRVEIDYKGWDPEHFPDEYEEGIGYCKDVL